MWLGKAMITDSSSVAAAAGGVKTSADRRVTAAAESGRSQYAMVAPPGIVSSPAAGSDAVVMQTSSGQLCIGVRTPYHGYDTEPGEVLLYSAGGAVLRVANDGKVYVNGREV